MMTFRILRGGSWFLRPHNCRSTYRNGGHPALLSGVVGFRVCCLPPAPAPSSPSPLAFISQMINKILRGGSWFNAPYNCRSADRYSSRPIHLLNSAGFRIAQPKCASSDITMITIPAGQFLMGSSNDLNSWDDEKPQHLVTINNPFGISQTPITQAQWRAVAALPKVEIDLKSDPSRFKGDDLPVECISWYDAMEFCARLSAATGNQYTLPTEAQWEYACRAGTTTIYNTGDKITKKQANYDGFETTPVFSYPPNAWGLHDMHGNVWEWCLDDWHDSYEGAPTDGSAWIDGDAK